MAEIRITCNPERIVQLLDDPPDGVTVDLVEVHRYDLTARDALVAVVAWVSSIPASVIAAWIFEKCSKAKLQSLDIDNQQCPLKDEDIRRIIEEVLAKQRQADKPEAEDNQSEPS